jgi:hypothetical protein
MVAMKDDGVTLPRNLEAPTFKTNQEISKLETKEEDARLAPPS